MKDSLLSLLTLAACLAALSPARAQDAKAYKITLHRPPVVGAKTRDVFQVKTERSQRINSGPKVLREVKETLQADFAGVTDPVEVSPNGKMQKVRFTVEKFSTQVNAGAAEEPLKAGTVVTGALDEKGKPAFSSSAGPIPPAAARVLAIVFELLPDRPNDSNDDIVFGTTQPRAVGSEWDVNKAELIKSMPPDVPFKLTEAQITGRMKFPSVKQAGGADECVVQGEVTMKPTEMAGLPPGFKVGGIDVVVSMNGRIPVNPKAVTPFSQATFRMKVSGQMDSPNGKVEMEMSESRDKQYRSELVK